MENYSTRSYLVKKFERIIDYYTYEFGYQKEECLACAGSGYYDHNGNPDCSACDGTGSDLKQTLKNSMLLKLKDTVLDTISLSGSLDEESIARLLLALSKDPLKVDLKRLNEYTRKDFIEATALLEAHKLYLKAKTRAKESALESNDKVVSIWDFDSKHYIKNFV
ncbi:MAG: hypothetical protein CL760_05330 [Chloroflexi bacterium]|nr:hypothetical protein [Chloroflexota bacterium]|tara:strand:+ start:27996 stop:28490 length:495 start_codon:yes stop_codon:yes gene_type:complete